MIYVYSVLVVATLLIAARALAAGLAALRFDRKERSTRAYRRVAEHGCIPIDLLRGKRDKRGKKAA